MRSYLGIAMVAALVAVGCSDEPAADYDQAFAADFAQECQAGVGGDNSGQACACWYERVSMEIPFDELPTLDDLMAPDADDETVDPAVYEQLADCVTAFGAAVSAPIVDPPPLTVPVPTTATTMPPVVDG